MYENPQFFTSPSLTTAAFFAYLTLYLSFIKTGVIRSNDSETEIENTKSHLTKYSFDVDKLYRWLSSDSLFNLKHLFAYFSDTLSDPKYTLKQNASLNILQPRRPQMGQEEEDPVIRNLDDTITKAFANFSAQIFAETQGPIVDTYKAPKLDNHYTQLFQHLPDTNLKSLLTSLDEIWNVVYHKPAEVIAAHITHKITLDLGLIDPNYSVISYSPQVAHALKSYHSYLLCRNAQRKVLKWAM